MLLQQGASRNHEPWREPDLAKAAALKEREDEEMGNAMKALENRTLDSKREMDIMAALDEMRTLKSQHARISTEAALAALSKQAQQEVGSWSSSEMQDREPAKQDTRQMCRLQVEYSHTEASLDLSLHGAGDSWAEWIEVTAVVLIQSPTRRNFLTELALKCRTNPFRNHLHTDTASACAILCLNMHW